MPRRKRDPLIGFLLAGLALFLIEASLGGEDSDREIVVTEAEVARFRGLFESQAGRAPTAAELQTLVDESVREEVLYREATRLGLDEGDVIVRRRLAQKMSFFLEDTAARKDAPSAEELNEFWRENQSRYLEPERHTFTHVYYSRDKRGERASSDAATDLETLELARLRSAPGPGDAWRQLGDPFMLHREYAERSANELRELFGGQFTEQIVELPIESWAGPIASAYGQHLVYVHRRAGARQLELDEVRSRVIEDFKQERSRESNRRSYEQLAADYTIRVEGLGDSPSPAAEAGSMASEPSPEPPSGGS